MVVFESILNKELTAQPQAQRTAFRREIRERLQELDENLSKDDTEAGTSNYALRTLELSQSDVGAGVSASKIATFSNFARSFLSGDLKLTVLSNIVYIGCVTEGNFSEEKASRFLNDLRSEFSKMYQGRLSLIKKQTNLTANVYDQPFKKAFQKILDNYSSGISNKNL